MRKLLSALNAVISGFLVWAIWYDLAHDKNEWWGTTLLVAWAAVSLASAVALWRVRGR
jgi:hypothetical protein